MGEKDKVSKDNSTTNNNSNNLPDNPWAFLAHATNILYNLLTLKKISLAVVFCVLLISLVYCIKTPFEVYIKPMYDICSEIKDTLSISPFTIIVTIGLVFSLIGNFIQRFFYTKEIKRLSEERKN